MRERSSPRSSVSLKRKGVTQCKARQSLRQDRTPSPHLWGEVPAQQGMGGCHRSSHASEMDETSPPSPTPWVLPPLRFVETLGRGEEFFPIFSFLSLRLSLSFRLSLSLKLKWDVREGGFRLQWKLE